MLKATVNRNKTFTISEEGGGLIIDDVAIDWDLSHDGRHFHILYKHRSYTAELISTDFVSKVIVIKINGEHYEVAIKDKMDLLLEQLGMTQATSSLAKNIIAPMPGLILQLHVKEGDEVKKGDAIMVLEAMKMENTLKSPGDGIVKNILVKAGDSVEKNQVLIDFKNSI